MKISELIELLQNAQIANGDLDTRVSDGSTRRDPRVELVIVHPSGERWFIL